MMLFDRTSGAAGAMCDALSGTDYVAKLEAALCALYGRACVVMSSADAAFHTALHLCGTKKGDYVFVPSFTFYSYVSTVTGMDAATVFIDCDPTTRCMSAAALEAAFVWASLQNKLPTAVVIDNAFGSVADFDVLTPLCKSYGVPVIELACDAFGGDYKGRPCGANGDYGVVAFTKRIDGGGGALVCGDEETAAREFSRGAFTENENHDYRMHNVIAALDFAQLPDGKKITARARGNLAALAAQLDCVARPTFGDAAAFALVRAANLTQKLKSCGFSVKTPPPVHMMPQYSTRPFFEHEPGFCVACTFSDCCLVDMDVSAGKRRRLAKLLKGV